jgi:hypothetical protein
MSMCAGHGINHLDHHATTERRPPLSTRELRFSSYFVCLRSTIMKILFINNDGGGFAGPVELPEGTTVSQFFGKQLPDAQPQDYLIRVDRLPAAADQRLAEGNRVSFTPTKIEGAV